LAIGIPFAGSRPGLPADEPEREAIVDQYLLLLVKRTGLLTWAVILCGLIAVVVGCGGDGLETVRVTGTVTIDGKPLTQGTVSFTPEKGRGATGQIASDGSFTLTTYKKGDGVVLGRHKVAVVAIDRQGAKPYSEESDDLELKWLIPQRYGNPYTSGLTFEVKAGEDNVATLELTSRNGPSSQ
jgi:hypothetical protein